MPEEAPLDPAAVAIPASPLARAAHRAGLSATARAAGRLETCVRDPARAGPLSGAFNAAAADALVRWRRE